MFQEHVKKIYLIAWDQQIQPLDCHIFLLQVVSRPVGKLNTSNVDNI